MLKESNSTILVVEDNEGVRELIVHLLEDAGFSVFAATNGASGFAIFKQHKKIDLVFSDLVLPGGMTGIELAKKIFDIHPGIPFLLGSGYGEKGKKIEKSVERAKNIFYVSKPYDNDDLLKQIDYIIGSTSMACLV